MNLSFMPHKWHRLLDFNLIHLQTSVKDRNIEIERNTSVRNDLTELNTLYRSHRAWDSLFLHAVNKLTLFWAPPLLLRVACSENLNRTSHRNELEISVHVFLVKCAHKVVNWIDIILLWAGIECETTKHLLSAILLNYTVMWLNTAKNRGKCLSQLTEKIEA